MQLSYYIAFGALCLVLFINQCDGVFPLILLPSIVLKCHDVFFVNDFINVLRVYALFKSCV